MKDIILLTKILFKESINTKKITFGKFLLFVFIYLYIAGLVGYVSYEIITSLIQINQQAVFLGICFVDVLVFEIVQTIFSSLNILFFSNDIQYLMPLPIKPIKIVIAKINCLIISQYIMELVLVLPAMILYGYLLNAGIVFYIMGLLIMIMFPVFPVILTTIIVTLIMKFTNIIKNKDMVQYLSVGLTLIFVISIQLLNTSNNSITNEELANMIVETNGLLSVYINFFITIKLAVNSLVNYNNYMGILNIVILILAAASVYILGALLISKIYIKSVTKIMSGGIKSKKKSSNEMTFKKASIVKSYVKKEFINLNRNPIFFMQCILPSILFPFIFGIPVFLSYKDMNSEDINMLKHLLIEKSETSIGIAVGLLIVVFFFMMNFISVTSISRDRNNANFMKYIPIDLEKQCVYKLIPGIILNFVPIMFFIVGFIYLVPSISVKSVIYFVILAILINIFNNYMMIIVDLKNPKLEWMTEYAVVKQNINMFFQIAIIVLEFGIIMFLGFKFSNLDMYVISVSLLYIIGICAVKKYISKNKNKLFSKVM